MGKRIDQLKLLSFSDWKILLFASFLLPTVALSLKLKGLKKTQSFIARCAPPPTPSSEPITQKIQEAQRIAKLVSISANHGIYKTNCLKQVLVIWYYLNKNNIISTLHIGIRKNKEQILYAHAWLECGGTQLIDSEKCLQRFLPILSSTRETPVNQFNNNKYT